MNNLKTNNEGYIISKDMISLYCLIGFIEGDGTFFFSYSSVIFGITKKDKKVLEIISEYLQDIPISPAYPSLVIPQKPKCILQKHNNKEAYKLVITNKDVLFQYIYPLFKGMTFTVEKV
jgi:hypothetical protein